MYSSWLPYVVFQNFGDHLRDAIQTIRAIRAFSDMILYAPILDKDDVVTVLNCLTSKIEEELIQAYKINQEHSDRV